MVLASTWCIQSRRHIIVGSVHMGVYRLATEVNDSMTLSLCAYGCLQIRYAGQELNDTFFDVHVSQGIIFADI